MSTAYYENGEWKLRKEEERVFPEEYPEPEIIRCRDCKWYDFYSFNGIQWSSCLHDMWASKGTIPDVPEDGSGYCFRAEKKETE